MTNLFFLGACITPAPDFGTYITDDFGNLVTCPVIQWLYAVESDVDLITEATELNMAAAARVKAEKAAMAACSRRAYLNAL